MSLVGERIKADIKLRLADPRWANIDDSPHLDDFLTAICEAIAVEVTTIQTAYNSHTHVPSALGSPTTPPSTPLA